MIKKVVSSLPKELTSLKRMKLVLPTKDNSRAELAAKAAVLLGYTGAMSSQGVAGELGEVLIKLDIKPYDVKRVIAYKKKAKREAYAKKREHTPSYYRISTLWKEIPLAGYTGTVPDFVLAKAIQIKELCPEAVFTVDTLQVNKKKIPDPFLIVKLKKDEKYWIEVWDESAFEKQLIDG